MRTTSKIRISRVWESPAAVAVLIATASVAMLIVVITKTGAGPVPTRRLTAPLLTLRPPGDLVAMELAPDGEMLACVSGRWPVDETETGYVWGRDAKGTLDLWKLPTGKLAHRILLHAAIYHLCFSPDGDTLVSVGDWDNAPYSADWEVRVWDVRSGRLKHRLPYCGFREGIALAFSPDGKMLAMVDLVDRDFGRSRETGMEEPGVILYDARTWQQKRELRGFPGYIPQEVAFSYDGRLFACSTDNPESASGELSIWEVETGRQIRWLHGQEAPTDEQIVPLFFLGRGHALACGKYLLDWSNSRSNMRPMLPVKDRKCLGLYSPAGNLVLCGVVRQPEVLELWDVRSQKLKRRWVGFKHTPLPGFADAPDVDELSLSFGDFSYQRELLAVVEPDGTVKIWQLG